MDKRQKKILIMAIAIILIGLIILLIYLYLSQKIKRPELINGKGNVNAVLPFNPSVSNTNGGFKTVEKEIILPGTNETQVQVVSKNFSERFGSYSNQSNFDEYLNDLTMLTTTGMEDFLKNFIRPIQTENPSYYHGFSTKVLKVKIIDLKSETAETLVSTQRTETNESQNIVNKIYYQDLKLKIVKVNNQWLVDGAWWQ